MNTKKDHIRAANIVAAMYDDFSRYYAAREAFVTFFEADNPRFDRARFEAACLSIAEKAETARKKGGE